MSANADITWLGSIVANAPDCLSGYRGFESHPSRHVGYEVALE